MVGQALPAELEWGQVYIEMLYAPVTPADMYTLRLGGVYDEDSKEPPFVAGHEGVAVVLKVGRLDANAHECDAGQAGRQALHSVSHCQHPGCTQASLTTTLTVIFNMRLHVHVLCLATQVGPGVTGLSEGDVVLPTAPLLGTFTQAAVVKAKQVVGVGRLASLEGSITVPAEAGQQKGKRLCVTPRQSSLWAVPAMPADSAACRLLFAGAT